MSKVQKRKSTAAFERRRKERSPWREWYNTDRWKKIKRAILGRYEVCNICLKEKPTIVDHVIPHKGDKEKFFSGPFQALCKRCHDSVKQKAENKEQQTGLDGWPVPNEMARK